MVVALTGWLRFGGGMANVAASHDPVLSFPFPRLEVETPDLNWKPVDFVVGAPCGKTKSIGVGLNRKTPNPSAVPSRALGAHSAQPGKTWDSFSIWREMVRATKLRSSWSTSPPPRYLSRTIRLLLERERRVPKHHPRKCRSRILRPG